MDFIYVFDENQEGVYKEFTLSPEGNNKNMTSVTKLGLAGKDDNVLVDQVHIIFSGMRIKWITADEKHKKVFSSKGDTVIYYPSNNSTTKEKSALLSKLLNSNDQKNTGLLEMYGDCNYIKLGKEDIDFIKNDNP